MYFTIFATDRPETAEVRSRHVEAFREYLHDHPGHPGVVLHLGGRILADDAQTPIGTHIVIEAPSLEAARAFIEDSPYGRADLFAELHVRPWKWITGRPGQD